MKAGDGSAEANRRAGEAAAAAVEDGMVVGLGTGSTAAYAIEAIGRAVADGLDVRGVATSADAATLARERAIPLTSIAVLEVGDSLDDAHLVHLSSTPRVSTQNATGTSTDKSVSTASRRSGCWNFQWRGSQTIRKRNHSEADYSRTSDRISDLSIFSRFTTAGNTS